jgi:hypothetical protein
MPPGHPTTQPRYRSGEIGGATRFRVVLWRGWFPAAARRVVLAVGAAKLARGVSFYEENRGCTDCMSAKSGDCMVFCYGRKMA